MFRAVPLSIIRILFTVHSALVYVRQVFRQLSRRNICSCSTAVYKPVWHIPLLSVQWINCWWWTEELPETCRVSWQNKFVKLVHLVGFITKKSCPWFLALCFEVSPSMVYNAIVQTCQIWWHISTEWQSTIRYKVHIKSQQFSMLDSFMEPSWQMPGQFLKLGNNHFTIFHSLLTMTLTCIWGTEGVIK